MYAQDHYRYDDRPPQQYIPQDQYIGKQEYFPREQPDYPTPPQEYWDHRYQYYSSYPPLPENQYMEPVKPQHFNEEHYNSTQSTYALNGQSRFDRGVYLSQLANFPMMDENVYIPPQQYYPVDQNTPANIPFIPFEQKASLIDQEIQDFIQNLPRFSQHQIEIQFAKYLAESIVIDGKLSLVQQELNKDTRFNSRMLFDYLDLKGNKHLDYTEFKLGLNKLDISFRDNECFNLFRRYSNDDGSISANEFHDMLVGWMDQPQKFLQYGTYHYMHVPFNRQQKQQYLTVLQRDLISKILDHQFQIERSLSQIRQVIGYDDILLALFRQIDYGEDVVQYMHELGGEFITLEDLYNTFYRISKLRCVRINFGEFQREFHLDTHLALLREQEHQGSPIKNKRQADFIQQLQNQQEKLKGERQILQQHQQEYQQQHPPQQSQEKPPLPLVDESPIKQSPQKQPEPSPFKSGVKQTEKQPPTQNVYFPGYSKYQLKKPQPHQRL